MATDCLVPTYLPASWKGVAFHVDSSNDAFGRRGEVYEYPLSEQVGYKDLGRKARRFKVEGYLVGGDQVAQTNAMALAAESAEPGMLIHPMFGPQLVACVELISKVEYKKEVRRTKLEFEFVEATPSMAPYLLGATISALFAAGSGAVSASELQATWAPTPEDVGAATRMSTALAGQIEPAIDEASFDAIAMLQRGTQASLSLGQPLAIGDIAPFTASDITVGVAAYQTFADVIEPIANGTATVRRIHVDAAVRLRAWNAQVVAEQANATPSVESLIVTARLALIRDFALAVAQAVYATVRDALNDLDFIMAVYDEEEVIAVRRCDDELTTAIRKARASTAQAILARNITLPGVAARSVDGVWPSLVVAHKLYFDGTRYADVESYNPQMSPFFVGRTAVAPAA